MNIPEDVLRVDEPIEGELSMMTTGAMGKLYGATGLVGKDEMNGRINPGLEPDDDLDAAEIEKLKAGVVKGEKAGSSGNVGEGVQMETFPDQVGITNQAQGHTAF